METYMQIRNDLADVTAQLKLALNNINGYRNMSKIMSQCFQEIDLNNLSQLQAEYLGSVVAYGFGSILCAQAMKENVLMLFASNDEVIQSMKENEALALKQVNDTLIGEGGEYFRELINNIAKQPINKTLDDSHRNLISFLNQPFQQQSKFLLSTTNAARNSLQKVATLKSIMCQTDLTKKNLDLTQFSSTLTLELYNNLDKLCAGKVRLTELANINQNLTTLAQQAIIFEDGNPIVDSSKVAKILIMMIPLQIAMNEALHISNIKTLQASSDFHKVIKLINDSKQYNFTHSGDMIAEITSLSLNTIAKSLVISSCDLDSSNFFNNIAELIDDPKLQTTIIKVEFESVLQLAPENMHLLIDEAEIFCNENAESDFTRLLLMLCFKYKLLTYHHDQSAESNSTPLQSTNLAMFVRQSKSDANFFEKPDCRKDFPGSGYNPE